MRVVRATTYDDWRREARTLLATGVDPDEVEFRAEDLQQGLFDQLDAPSQQRGHAASATVVPKRFLELAEKVACHRDARRFQWLYRLLWRLTHGESHLLDVVTDDDVYRLVQMEKAVRRDAHKMKAFVRFRRLVEDGQERFVAWHRPDHRIVKLTAPFFARRFPAMLWTIMTPDESVSWDQGELTYGPGVPASSAPRAEEVEQLWRTYYASIFNPARIKLQAMKREMPVRHWRTLPETDLIPQLLADAPRRVSEMIARQEGSARSAADFVPASADYAGLKRAAAHCEGCDLHRSATQTVFGEGPVPARVMLVGEQPGDSEDVAGRPFVGPAGELLDEVLQAVGLDRRQVYVTNTVKHFKWQERGKWRLHKKPDSQEITACQPWLQAEILLVRPEILVCLGATAAQALIGRDFRITRQRGQWLSTRWCTRTLATYHPSAALRAPTAERRAEVIELLTADLARVAENI